MSDVSEKRFVKVDGVSKILRGRAKSSIYRDVKNGDLPKPFKIGGSTYWDVDEVIDHMQKRRSATA